MRPKRAKQTGQLKHYAHSPTHARRSTGENATVCYKWSRTRPYVEVSQVNRATCVRAPFCSCCSDLLPRLRLCAPLYRWYSFVFISNHTWSHVMCVCMLLPVVPPQLIAFALLGMFTKCIAFKNVHLRHCFDRAEVQSFVLLLTKSDLYRLIMLFRTHTDVAVITCLHSTVLMIKRVANFPTIFRRFNSLAL